MAVVSAVIAEATTEAAEAGSFGFSTRRPAKPILCGIMQRPRSQRLGAAAVVRPCNNSILDTS